jgi:translation initiation factor 5
MVVDDQFAKDLAALPTAEETGADDNDWAVDTSAEAAAARMRELSVKLPGGKDEDDLIDSVEEFANYVTQNKDSISDQDIIQKAQELEVREDKAVTVLAQILLDENVLKGKQIKKRAKLFKQFTKTEKCQKGLLGGIERLVIVVAPKLLPSVSLILKELYEEDLVEEEVFLAWDEKASKKYVDKKDAKLVREKAAPFTHWLREAEEESD